MKEKKAGYAGWLGRMAAVLALFVLLLLPVSARADETPVLSKTKRTMVQFGTKTLKLKGAEADKVEWMSSNDLIARVSKKGVVTARYPGSCRIIAKYEGKKYFCKITVKSLKIVANNLTLVIGSRPKYQLKLNCKVPGVIRWSSTDNEVVTVNSNGLVRAKSVGECQIIAKYRGIRCRCKVTVKPSTYKALKKKYPVTSNNKGKILLFGSSTLQLWKDFSSAFAPYDVINMGISFTKVTQWSKWYKDLIVPYKPSAVIMYVGNNDIGNGDLSGKQNANNTIRLLENLQRKLPDTKIFYVSLVPCWRRQKAWSNVRESNRIVKRYCSQRENIIYVNIVSAFTDADGKPLPELFKEDRLHPNNAGYEIWKRIVAKKVKKELRANR